MDTQTENTNEVQHRFSVASSNGFYIEQKYSTVHISNNEIPGLVVSDTVIRVNGVTLYLDKEMWEHFESMYRALVEHKVSSIMKRIRDEKYKDTDDEEDF